LEEVRILQGVRRSIDDARHQVSESRLSPALRQQGSYGSLLQSKGNQKVNAALIAQLILQGLQQLQTYQQLLLKAQAEGRDVTDAEIDALGALGAAIRDAARAEAARQRAGG
jgi:hypothetical protein